MEAGTEISKMINEFEEEVKLEKHIKNVVAAFEEEGNPLQEESILVSLVKKYNGLNMSTC